MTHPAAPLVLLVLGLALLPPVAAQEPAAPAPDLPAIARDVEQAVRRDFDRLFVAPEIDPATVTPDKRERFIAPFIELIGKLPPRRAAEVDQRRIQADLIEMMQTSTSLLALDPAELDTRARQFTAQLASSLAVEGGDPKALAEYVEKYEQLAAFAYDESLRQLGELEWKIPRESMPQALTDLVRTLDFSLRRFDEMLPRYAEQYVRDALREAYATNVANIRLGSRNLFWSAAMAKQVAGLSLPPREKVAATIAEQLAKGTAKPPDPAAKPVYTFGAIPAWANRFANRVCATFAGK